jgi:phage-related protein
VPWNQELYFDLPPPPLLPQQHQPHHSSKVNSASSTTHNSNSTTTAAQQQQQQQQPSQAAAVVSGMRKSVSRTYLAALGSVHNSTAAATGTNSSAVNGVNGNASDDDGTVMQLSRELPVIRIGLSNGGEVLLRRQDILASKVLIITTVTTYLHCGCSTILRYFWCTHATVSCVVVKLCAADVICMAASQFAR